MTYVLSTKCALAVLVVALLGALVVPAIGANLLVNGDLELPEIAYDATADVKTAPPTNWAATPESAAAHGALMNMFHMYWANAFDLSVKGGVYENYYLDQIVQYEVDEGGPQQGIQYTGPIGLVNANSLYTISMDAGWRNNYAFGGYELLLYAGDTVIASSSADSGAPASLAQGFFTTVSAYVDTRTIDPSLIGQLLGVKVQTKPYAGAYGITIIDNVALTESPLDAAVAVDNGDFELPDLTIWETRDLKSIPPTNWVATFGTVSNYAACLNMSHLFQSNSFDATAKGGYDNACLDVVVQFELTEGGPQPGVIYTKPIGLVEPNEVYTLSMDVGWRSDVPVFAGYELLLYAGDTVIASSSEDIGSPASLVRGNFTTVSASVDASTIDPSLIGQPLGITIQTKPYAGAYGITIIDNVKLVAGVQVATPAFTPDGGGYAVPQSVTMSCETSGASIHYTTDGTAPDQSKTLYTGAAIAVNQNMTIKARAYKGASTPSEIKSATYSIGAGYSRPKTIPYAGSAITIDGNIAEWADAAWTPLNEIYHGTPYDIAEAYYAAKWSPDKVYMAVKVRDTAHSFTSGYAGWDARDAVELYIHTTGSGPATYAATQIDAQEYVVGLKPGGAAVWSVVGNDQPIPTQAGFEAAGKIVNDAQSRPWLQYEVAMIPHHRFSLSGTGLEVSTLSSGMVIGLDATAIGHNGSVYTGMMSENLMTGKYNNYNLFGQHLLVSASGIAGAKTTADGAAVGFSGIVSADFGDHFYVEDPDRSYGIRVDLANHGLTVGQAVSGSGIMDTLDSGERCIIAVDISTAGTGQIDPLGMNNKALGGGDLGILPNGQCGVSGGTGLNTIGLLVKTTGKVGTKGIGWFVIDDGSGVSVKVIGTVPANTPYVSVTGISTIETPGGDRVIMATSDAQEFVP